MDAERLIAVSRRDLAESREVRDVMAAAWRAQRLAQAVGDLVALSGPREVRGEARALAETGGRGGEGVAVRLTEVTDLRRTLLHLGALLGDVGIALVGVACATDEEGLYWQSIDAMDAADESRDRVRAMLARLPGQTPSGTRASPEVRATRARPPGTPPRDEDHEHSVHEQQDTGGALGHDGRRPAPEDRVRTEGERPDRCRARARADRDDGLSAPSHDPHGVRQAANPADRAASS
ncbi:DUF6099 family protein [Streptomyces sp. MUM 203J]|uniref:DUF6099 family protein n=1 Tax=Streptomyces sp. MUM 203J TaxID=2791990 RepID=UPI0035ABE388